MLTIECYYSVRDALDSLPFSMTSVPLGSLLACISRTNRALEDIIYLSRSKHGATRGSKHGANTPCEKEEWKDEEIHTDTHWTWRSTLISIWVTVSDSNVRQNSKI